MEELKKVGLSLILVYSSHFGATQFYSRVCVPQSLMGYIQGLITTSSPLCHVALHTMVATESQYSSMIIVVVSALAMKAIGI